MESQATRRQEVQLQGPKPAALMVNRNSTKIKKQQRVVPVIVHLRSPKVIHVRPEEFMGLVQHLTGNVPVSSSAAPDAPAAAQSHSPTHHPAASTVEPTPQQLELIRSPVTAMNHGQEEDDFMPRGLPIDFHALMQQHFVS